MKERNIEELEKEIQRLRVAIQKTTSPYLKRDYQKAQQRLEKQLAILKRKELQKGIDHDKE